MQRNGAVAGNVCRWGNRLARAFNINPQEAKYNEFVRVQNEYFRELDFHSKHFGEYENGRVGQVSAK